MKILVFVLALGAANQASAQSFWSVSASEELQHRFFAQGLKLRAAYRYNQRDEVGLATRVSAVPSDYRDGFAIAIHGAINVRRQLAFKPHVSLNSFAGVSVGLGFWTTCVWQERCGGFGPSLGIEYGVTRAISKNLRFIGSLQLDAHSSLLAGEAVIPITSLSLGIQY